MLYYKTNLTFLSDFRIYLETPSEKLPKSGGEIMEQQQARYRVLREAYEKRIGLKNETEERRRQLYQEDRDKIDTVTPFNLQIQAGETLSGIVLKYLKVNGKQCAYKQALLWIIIGNLAEQRMNVDHMRIGDTVTIEGNLFSVKDAKGKIRSQVRIDALGSERTIRLEKLKLLPQTGEPNQPSPQPNVSAGKQEKQKQNQTPPPIAPPEVPVPAPPKASETKETPKPVWERIEVTPSADDNIHILALHSPNPLTTLWRTSPDQIAENRMLVGTSPEITELLPNNKYDASNKELVLRIDSITFHPLPGDPLDNLLKKSKRAEVKAVRSKNNLYLFVRGDNNLPLVIQFSNTTDIHQILTTSSYSILPIGSSHSFPSPINADNVDAFYKSLQ